MTRYTYTLIKDGRAISLRRATTARRFGGLLASAKSQIQRKKGVVHLKVNYGRMMSNFGVEEEFINEGYYDNYEDLLLAWQAFRAID